MTPHLLNYDPNGLQYQLSEEPDFQAEHPIDPRGDHTPVVGVHQVVSEKNGQEGTRGILLWHTVPLAAWTGTRAAYAAADEDQRLQARQVGPAFDNGKWGTHLGATLTLITHDGKVVLRSRKGKYAEDHLYDSYVAGTMRIVDLDGVDTTTDYLVRLLREAGISEEDTIEVRPTHLAIRASDFGLWVGGWVSTRLTAEQVCEIAPFETVVTDLDNTHSYPITEWGAFDLNAAKVHLRGDMLQPPIALP